MKNLIKLNFLNIFILFLVLGSFSLEAVEFQGKVWNESQNKPEVGAGVLVFETKRIFKTDTNGLFKGEVPEEGPYTIRIILATGMIEKKVRIEAGMFLNLNSSPQERTTSKGAIQVMGEREKTSVSRTSVGYEEIKRMPGTFGEALRGIETLPGITPPLSFGGGANSFIVRGADPSWNTYLYDDLPILYPFHTDGLTSVIHNDLIKSIDLYSGAYPANYNNATGGVIDIETTSSPAKTKAALQVTLWNTTSMVSTPAFGGKGSVSIAGKVGYLDKSIALIADVPEGVNLPKYTDSQVKVVYDLDPKNRLIFYNLTAGDSLSLNIPNKENNDPTKDSFSAYAGGNLSIGQRFRTTAIRHIWTPIETLSNRLTLINYDTLADNNISVGSLVGKIYNRNAYTGLRQDLTWNPTNWFKADLGSEFRMLSSRIFGTSVVQNDPSNPAPNPFDTLNPAFSSIPVNQGTGSNYYNAYLSLTFKWKGLVFTPGARYDHLGAINNGALAPRANLSYKFGKEGYKTGIIAGAGEFTHQPLAEYYNKDTGNPDLKFEKARKYSLGLEQAIGPQWNVKVEGFGQEFRDIVVQDPYIYTPLSENTDSVTKYIQPYYTDKKLNYSNKGTGWSRGYEVILRKNHTPGVGEWFGWISYTYSKSMRNEGVYQMYDGDPALSNYKEIALVNQYYTNSKEQAAPYSRTHVLNFVFGWKISDKHQLGARWTYLTSAPIIPITGDDGGQFSNPANGQTYWNETYSNNPYSSTYGYSRRGKDYQRLDIRWDIFHRYDWGYVNWYLEIVNVYMRKNVSGEEYDNTKPYSRTNPKDSEVFGTLVVGSSTVIPFFNVGMEIRL
ncbi:TonB-dependent receptor [Leptospira sarikeiensis]|uniref:TonB-dependent receptor n=1 Tax=Leptospira sarikeiensis TaxID=2484943 RepID=A0A4R9K356_9LEPT|nr:TonB-dependent receptor plug domain-containing protein [Leptospira sarikeiensis]TGL60480.1 TonB-dependent receptor [Leptospira sarikeiensis]